MKYTKEVLEPIVLESFSFADVIRGLGLRWSGGTQSNIVRRVRLAGLDTSHFLGQGHNRGKQSNRRLHWKKVLVLHRSGIGKKESALRLRRAMVESGIPHQCVKCGCLPEWQGSSLVLEIDHRNGDNLDNRKKNVRFLCPNCHSQTENFGSKNFSRGRGGTADTRDSESLG